MDVALEAGGGVGCGQTLAQCREGERSKGACLQE